RSVTSSCRATSPTRASASSPATPPPASLRPRRWAPRTNGSPCAWSRAMTDLTRETPPATARATPRAEAEPRESAPGDTRTVIAGLLSPDRAAAEGAGIGQLAAALPGGGLLISASRLVEFGARAAILLAPGLFRLDLTPQ